jgi:phage/plasmid-like protein (TIGR03299 family)
VEDKNMAANVESMFYVRQTPWHGLGEKVENALTSKEALEKAGLNWNVSQHPVHVNGLVVEGYKANVRDSDNKTLGIVSNKYKVVQNSEAFEFTDNLLNHDCMYETAGSLCEGKRIWLLAKLPEKRILDEEVSPYLVFSNSHDGTGAIRIAITPVRVVCQNTLNLALTTCKRSWSTKHVGNMEFKLEEAKRTLELANTYMNELNFESVRMASEIVTDAEFRDFLDKLFPYPISENTDRKTENIKTIRKNLSNIYYNTDDISEFIGTQYGVIQAVSDMVTHSKPLRLTSTYQERLFTQIIDGHGVIDKAYELLKVM